LSGLFRSTERWRYLKAIKARSSLITDSQAFWNEMEYKDKHGRQRPLYGQYIRERSWRSVKYEEAHIKEYGRLPDARAGLTEYFQRNNRSRLHRALGCKTPNEVYRFSQLAGGLPPEWGAVFLKSVAQWF
jgi:hypothetical protein